MKEELVIVAIFVCIGISMCILGIILDTWG